MDGNDLRLIREVLGLTRQDFAYLLGCSSVQVLAMETSRRTISAKYRTAALDVVRGRDFNDRIGRVADIREELEREHRNGEI